MGPYGRKNLKRHLLWKYIADLLPKILHTSRQGVYQSCIKIGEIWNFGLLPFFVVVVVGFFFAIFFVFINMITDSHNNFMHTSSEGLCQSCIKIGEIWNFWIFANLFSFSLTWNHMGEKISNDILSESTQQISSQKSRYTPGKGLYQSCIKNYDILNFGFLANLFIFWTFNMGVNGEL